MDRPRRARLRDAASRPASSRSPAPRARPRWAGPTRSSCSRRQGGAVRAARACRTGRCRRTSRPPSRRCATGSTEQDASPVASRTRTRGHPRPARRARRHVPVRRHHLPADRAPHRRRDEPHAVPAGRAAARAVLRGLARRWRRERGLENGGWATIITARAAIEARVLVTRRIRPLRIPGEGVIHQVGLPYHWGSEGLVTGDSVNDLLPFALDPNVFIQESKVATCDIRPGRRPRGRGATGAGHAYRREAGLELGAADRRKRGTSHRTRARPVHGRLAHDVSGDAGYAGHPPRVGFFTDTSVCIGCKACEVACKEWNGLPDPEADVLKLTGMSYDNTGALGANSWRHVAFIEQTVCPPGRRQPSIGPLAADEPDGDGGGHPVADGLGRVQALHPRRLPGRLPDRRAGAHRVRHRDRAAGRVQRLRLLRVRLPVRRHRPARGRRPGLEVHHVLRPAARRPGARLRQGLPDRLDPVRPAGRAARDRADPAGGAARGRRDRGPALRRGPRRRRRRGGRVLPAAGRARGLRPAAGPGGDHQGPAARCGGGPGWPPPCWPAASPWRSPGAGRGGRGTEQEQVPEAEFRSYYGRPILKVPRWKAPHLPAYLYLGDLSGASPAMGAAAAATGRRGAGPGGPGHRGRGGHGRHRSSSPSWAGPSGSCTCCGSPSRPRR